MKNNLGHKTKGESNGHKLLLKNGQREKEDQLGPPLPCPISPGARRHNL
jgi:hypothetical protein